MGIARHNDLLLATTVIKPVVMPVLVAALGLVLTGQSRAQTLTTLHSFTGTDGATPFGGLVLFGNTLYSTTSAGGSSGSGTVFALNTDGTGFTVLHSFTARDLTAGFKNTDGVWPQGVLTLSGNTLYGTAPFGGSSCCSGTVFSLNTDGTGFVTPYTFSAVPSSSPVTNSDRVQPLAGVILSGSTLYGTATGGGSSGNGTVFALNTDGSGFTNLHNFSALSDGLSGTNSDGASPGPGLILSGNTLYGTTERGGSFNGGTVFAINTDVTSFRVVHSFTSSLVGINADGTVPRALVQSGNTLYGTTQVGGAGQGVVFAVNSDGTGFSVLHNFSRFIGFGGYINTDGANPVALVLFGNTLYGATSAGGSSGSGTVFALNTDGTGFTVLYSFSAVPSSWINSDGALPGAELLLSGNTLYGTTTYGGSYGNGTVFSLFFTPQLSIIPARENVILSWPTNYAGFDYSGYTLQSTTNLALPIWTTNLSASVVVNGQNTVTNPVSGTQQFFRLSQ